MPKAIYLPGMVNIRPVLISELDHLVTISRETFWNAFSQDNSVDNMQLYLNEQLTHEQLLAELKHKNMQFYFLESNDQILGYLKTIVHYESRYNISSPSLEIERLYVVQAEQGHGYGSRLFEFAIQKAQDNECKHLWLGVWERNYKAIDFYKSKGMHRITHHIFQLGKDLQTDWIMLLPIN
jgi:GNAT superfamily N-acetyltransferase